MTEDLPSKEAMAAVARRFGDPQGEDGVIGFEEMVALARIADDIGLHSPEAVALRTLLRKIAAEAGVALYPEHDPMGLGFDYCFVPLAPDEIALWRSVTE